MGKHRFRADSLRLKLKRDARAVIAQAQEFITDDDVQQAKLRKVKLEKSGRVISHFLFKIIVACCCIDRLRKESRQKTISLDGLQVTVEVPVSHDGSKEQVQQKLTWLYKQIAALKGHSRSIMMAYMHGKSLKETALALRITETNCRQKKHRALKKIRKAARLAFPDCFTI